MFSFISNLVDPIIRRVGSGTAVFLVSQGITEGQADAIRLGIIAAAGIAVDLIAERLSKRFR